MQELIKALIKAKSEFSPIQKDRVNPHFKHKYATLDAVLDAVTPALGKHGLAVVQTTALSDGKTVLQTHLYHESGECLTSVYPLPEISDSQKFGAALTYARRYALCAILCVTADEDDDANAAVNTLKKQHNPNQYKVNTISVNSNGEHPNNSRVRAVRQLLGIDGKAVLEWLKTEKLVSSPAELESGQVNELIGWMSNSWADAQGVNFSSFAHHMDVAISSGEKELDAIKRWMQLAVNQQFESVGA